MIKVIMNKFENNKEKIQSNQKPSTLVYFLVMVFVKVSGVYFGWKARRARKRNEKNIWKPWGITDEEFIEIPEENKRERAREQATLDKKRANIKSST